MDIKAVVARSTHSLLRRLKQAILGGLVGCLVTVIGENQVGEVICSGATQNTFIFHPSMATESVGNTYLTNNINDKCAGSEARNLGISYRFVSCWFIMNATWPNFRQGSPIIFANTKGEEWDFQWKLTNACISNSVCKFIGWGQSAVFDSDKCFRPSSTINSLDPDFVNKYISAQLALLGVDCGIGLCTSSFGESSSFSNGGGRLGDGGKGVGVLLIGGSFRLTDDRPIIAMRDSQREDRGGGSGDKSPKGKPFTLAFTALVAVGLVAISGMFSRHAVYACRDRSDSSYYLFMLFSFLAIFGGFFLLATICGFFPDSPLPHLNLF
jgi:hypothetical protein